MRRGTILLVLLLVAASLGTRAMADERVSVPQAGPRLLTPQIEQLPRTARQPVRRAPAQVARQRQQAPQSAPTRQATPVATRVVRDIILDFGELTEDIPIVLPTVGSGVRIVAR